MDVGYITGRFPSGQRGQTVNLLAMPSKVQILLSPKPSHRLRGFFLARRTGNVGSFLERWSVLRMRSVLGLLPARTRLGAPFQGRPAPADKTSRTLISSDLSPIIVGWLRWEKTRRSASEKRGPSIVSSGRLTDAPSTRLAPFNAGPIPSGRELWTACRTGSGRGVAALASAGERHDPGRKSRRLYGNTAGMLLSCSMPP